MDLLRTQEFLKFLQNFRMELFDRYFWMILLNFKDSDLAAFLTKKNGCRNC